MNTKALTIPEETPELTLDQLKAVMPARQKQNITQGLVDSLNSCVAEPEYRENFRQNILGYADVLTDPNTTMEGYIHAIKYVGYTLMGYTNQESWMRTFPQRFQRLLDEEKPEAYIRSLVCAYNKGKLVNRIREQAMIPTWLLNQDKFQQAINVQAVLMTSASSEKVRTDAANSLLTHLRQPEATKVTLDVNVKQDDSIAQLRDAMIKLGTAQADAIRLGISNAKDIVESRIIEGEKV